MFASSFLRPTLPALAALALCLPAAVMAKTTTTGGAVLTGVKHNLTGIAPTSTTDYTFDVSGIFSVDGPGSALNEVFSFNIGAGSRVVGIGWDVTLFADSPSYLSELVVRFGGTSSWSLNLTPGVGFDDPGTESFSSEGVLDLVGIELDFSVDADGQLKLEFFEGFDDFPGDWDGRWESGALTIRVMSAIPEPGTYGMMMLGLGMLGAFAAKSRRKA